MRQLTYSHEGLDEQLLSFGSDSAAKHILIIPPLFDEMNRMRSTLVSAIRSAAESRIACALPDLPGSNESAAKIEEQSLSKWRDAMTAAAKAFGATHIFSIRGGSLIDNFDPATPVARLAPVKGKSLLNMLIRTRIAGDKEMGLSTKADDLNRQAANAPVELAGNNIGPAMWHDLEKTVPDEMINNVEQWTVKDVAGSALWLRAEPQYDAQMANGLAEMLISWSAAV